MFSQNQIAKIEKFREEQAGIVAAAGFAPDCYREVFNAVVKAVDEYNSTAEPLERIHLDIRSVEKGSNFSVAFYCGHEHDDEAAGVTSFDFNTLSLGTSILPHIDGAASVIKAQKGFLDGLNHNYSTMVADFGSQGAWDYQATVMSR